MDKKIWKSEAPSNIALIKYMGKKDSTLNTPDNPSLSYTLPHLTTAVELELNDNDEDIWEPLKREGYMAPSLGPKETVRYLSHLKRLKEEFGVTHNFTVRSANSFPQNCGLASSASSFAALTKASCVALSELLDSPTPELKVQASLSRMGSGSSCRSFISPWCMWSGDQVNSIKFPYTKLLHMVVVADEKKKKVSSSEAHNRVATSLLYKGRVERATIRLGLFIEAMSLKNWSNAFELCWAEFWDMHALFETANPSFGYMTQKTFEILHHAKSIWTRISDGPLVTMDAGPNVHLLFRPEQALMAKDLKEKYIAQGHSVYSKGF